MDPSLQNRSSHGNPRRASQPTDQSSSAMTKSPSSTTLSHSSSPMRKSSRHRNPHTHPRRSPQHQLHHRHAHGMTHDDLKEFNDIIKSSPEASPQDDQSIIGRDGHNRFVLLPDHPFRGLWDVFILNLVIYVAFISVFLFSFLDAIGTSSPFFWVERFLDIAFGIDIILNFFTAYEDEVYITSLPAIASRYLKTWFLVDLIGTIPWGLIALRTDDETESALLRLPRFLRLLRLFKLFRIMRVIRLKEIFTWIEIRFRLKYGHAQLVGLAFTISLIGHWVACLFYFFGTLNSQNIQPGGIASWIEETPSSLYGKYITSLYFSIYTITTIGYGDVVPRTILERTYVTVIMVIGAACFAYAISKMSDIVGALSATSVQQRDMMDRLSTFASRRKLTPRLEFEVRRYFTYHYSSKRIEDEMEMLGELSDRLKLLVLRHIYGKLLMDTPLFRDICAGSTDGACDDRLDIVYPCIEEMSHLDKDTVIFEEGDKTSGLFIVQRGNVRLCTSTGHTVYARRGNCFGDVNLIIHGRRRETAQCTGYTQLLFVPRESIVEVLQQYPGAVERARQEDASTLWEDTLGLLERRVRLVDMASELNRKAEEYLKEQNRFKRIDRRSENGSGSRSAVEEDVPFQKAAETSTDEESIESLRKELELKDEIIRDLQLKLVNVRQELGSLFQVLK